MSLGKKLGRTVSGSSEGELVGIMEGIFVTYVEGINDDGRENGSSDGGE